VIKSWLVRSKERFYNNTATRSDTRIASKNAPIGSENASTNPTEEMPSTQLKKATTVTATTIETTIETQIEEQSK